MRLFGKLLIIVFVLLRQIQMVDKIFVKMNTMPLVFVIDNRVHLPTQIMQQLKKIKVFVIYI